MTDFELKWLLVWLCFVDSAGEMAAFSFSFFALDTGHHLLNLSDLFPLQPIHHPLGNFYATCMLLVPLIHSVCVCVADPFRKIQTLNCWTESLCFCRLKGNSSILPFNIFFLDFFQGMCTWDSHPVLSSKLSWERHTPHSDAPSHIEIICGKYQEHVT